MATSTLFETVPRGSIRDVLAGQILTAAVRGDFPAGSRLVVQRLAEQFGVSATPVREALAELASRGIVENTPNRGAVMRDFGPVQIREIYQLRRVLEVEAVRNACGKIDRESLERLKTDFEKLAAAPRDDAWSGRAMDIDVRLHALIAAHCGSDRLREELARYNTLVQVVREVVDNEHRAQEIALAEHLKIIAHLLAADAHRAAETMADHIRRTAVLVEAALFSNLVDAAVRSQTK